MIETGSKVKIISLGKQDAHYNCKEGYINKEGIITDYLRHDGGGWFGCDIKLAKTVTSFYKAKLKELK